MNTDARAMQESGRTVVLLIDDQAFIGAVLGRLLATELDIELHCCCNGAEAIEAANQLRPSIILQDLVMPDIDGLTLVRSFRANPSTATTPIIVLSGNDDQNSRVRARELGANDYRVKLPGKDDLIACIRRHAGKHQSDCRPFEEEHFQQ
jgi:PleD family two-component response regulator